MNEADIAIIVVLLVSVLIGVSRGVVREIIAIAGWVAAAWISCRFAPALAHRMTWLGTGELLRVAAAGVLLVIATLFGFALLSRFIAKLLSIADIGFEDRVIGAVFGLARGVLVVCLAVFLLGFTPAPDTGWWRESILIVPCERTIEMVLPWLPRAITALRA